MGLKATSWLFNLWKLLEDMANITAIEPKKYFTACSYFMLIKQDTSKHKNSTFRAS